MGRSIMTRKEMLAILGKLKFALIWPGNWEDVGFTEHEIWVNSIWYGYIMCDEPTQCWKGPGLGKEKWSEVKEKIDSKSLTYNDIDGTSLVEMLNAIYSGYNGFENSTQLCEDLSDLAMTNYPERYFYALAMPERTLYFETDKEFKTAYERDWVDEAWEDMDDAILCEWIKRLRIEDEPSLKEWAKELSRFEDSNELKRH